MKSSSLKTILDRFYLEYDFEERVGHDPISFPGRYKAGRDREISGFISSCFAYGKVELFKAVLEALHEKMGRSPYGFVLAFDPVKQGGLFGRIKYRFNERDDILCLFFVLSQVLKRYSSLEEVFMKYYRPEDGTIRNGLEGLMSELLSIDTSAVYGSDIRPRGFRQLFPLPSGGSACKRANLFLRWMIRDRDIDFGVWKGVPKNRLVIPLDTHIARISRCLRFTERQPQDWKTAVEITEALKRLDPEDPLKYDFALCHHGISGLCKGERENNRCKDCVFRRG